jgi:LysM repeat protein
MNKINFPKRGLRASTQAVILLLVFALLAIAPPKPAQAAGSKCVKVHIYAAGETKAQIAKAYGMSWKNIASNNKLHAPYNLKPGQKLCIPAASRIKIKYTITAAVTSSQVIVSVNLYPSHTIFQVKVRGTGSNASGWYSLGNMWVDKNNLVKSSFVIPAELKGASSLNVCVKNMETNELICKTAAKK